MLVEKDERNSVDGQGGKKETRENHHVYFIIVDHFYPYSLIGRDLHDVLIY